MFLRPSSPIRQARLAAALVTAFVLGTPALAAPVFTDRVADVNGARAATVISGTWHFGYGARFDDGALKALPPGSFYTEPRNQPHFARTGDTR